MSVPMYRRIREGWISGAPAKTSSHYSGLSVAHAWPTCRATAAGVGYRKVWGSQVDPC